MKAKKLKYPAKYNVMWPSGPVMCCEEHAEQLKTIGGILGHFVAVIEYKDLVECENCINQNK